MRGECARNGRAGRPASPGRLGSRPGAASRHPCCPRRLLVARTLNSCAGGTCVAPPRRRHPAYARSVALRSIHTRPASPGLCGGRACSCTMPVRQGQGVLPPRVRSRAPLRPRRRIPGVRALCGKICAASSGGSCGLLGSLREASQAPQVISGCSVWPIVGGAAPCNATAAVGPCARRALGAAWALRPPHPCRPRARRQEPRAAAARPGTCRLIWGGCRGGAAVRQVVVCVRTKRWGSVYQRAAPVGLCWLWAEHSHRGAAGQALCGCSGGREFAAAS